MEWKSLAIIQTWNSWMKLDWAIFLYFFLAPSSLHIQISLCQLINLIKYAFCSHNFSAASVCPRAEYEIKKFLFEGNYSAQNQVPVCPPKFNYCRINKFIAFVIQFSLWEFNLRWLWRKILNYLWMALWKFNIKIIAENRH